MGRVWAALAWPGQVKQVLVLNELRSNDKFWRNMCLIYATYDTCSYVAPHTLTHTHARKPVTHTHTLASHTLAHPVISCIFKHTTQKFCRWLVYTLFVAKLLSRLLLLLLSELLLLFICYLILFFRVPTGTPHSSCRLCLAGGQGDNGMSRSPGEQHLNRSVKL